LTKYFQLNLLLKLLNKNKNVLKKKPLKEVSTSYYLVAQLLLKITSIIPLFFPFKKKEEEKKIE
jgi:hypothetical protein